jgi:hypothetical protein
VPRSPRDQPRNTRIPHRRIQTTVFARLHSRDTATLALTDDVRLDPLEQ